MMKLLLIIIASFAMMNASAQVSCGAGMQAPQYPQHSAVDMPKAKMQEKKMRRPGDVLATSLKRAAEVKPYYRRPAGAFYSSFITENGVFTGVQIDGILLMKPYCNYTFYSYGDDENGDLSWEYDAGDGHHSVNTRNLTVRYEIEVNDAPLMYYGGNECFQYPYYSQTMGGYYPSNPARVYSVPTTRMVDGANEYLLSSKTFCLKGRNGDQETPLTYYSGPRPFGSNEFGWWFGKNGCHQNFWSTYYVDGIAQAFEKPTSPYLLKKVMMQCAVLDVLAPVEMTCKIYKLNRIPAYNETASVSLPEVPGELIALGHGTVTPRTFEDLGGLVTFDLFKMDEDGLESDVELTIDCAILVVVEGYNDSNMSNLRDFSAQISTDMEVDEGFGEMAYIKYGTKDSSGNVTFLWKGLNNFFYDGMMKTGFSIFIIADMPYLAFNDPEERGEYVFGTAGGAMQRQVGGVTVNGIEFKAWTPSADDGWTITCRGEEPPEWLEIELVDGAQNGKFNNIVKASVSAEPLPEGVAYREAVIRFAMPGAYLDYKFMQGEQVGPGLDGDYNGDGEINVADLNFLINLILSGAGNGDITGDGETNIADINALIDIILSNV